MTNADAEELEERELCFILSEIQREFRESLPDRTFSFKTPQDLEQSFVEISLFFGQYGDPRRLTVAIHRLSPPDYDSHDFTVDIREPNSIDEILRVMREFTAETPLVIFSQNYAAAWR